MRERESKTKYGITFRTLLLYIRENEVIEGEIRTGLSEEEIREEIELVHTLYPDEADIHIITDEGLDQNGQSTPITYVALIDRNVDKKELLILTTRNTRDVRKEAEMVWLTDTQIHIWPKYGASNDL